MLGEPDKAFHALDRALIDDPVDIATWIRSPEFDSIRSDPRYSVLVRRMSLPE